jgi:N,N'-diacetyllegionaminate synthase
MIIAELSHNHKGDPLILKEMVEKAAAAGGTFCKIQSFFAEDLDTSNPRWAMDYDRVKCSELNWDLQATFVEWCKEKGMIPMTTIYDAKYLPMLSKAGFGWIKIGSPQVMDQNLVKTCIATGFKVIISTGGHDLRDIPKFGPISGVLHCQSEYPTHPHKANLARMLEIKHLWPRTAIGYSSHIDPSHEDWHIPLKLASYLGASYIEVHFSILPRSETKDGPVSLTNWQLKQIADFDKLDHTEKLREYPWFGFFKAMQSGAEFELIKEYKTRWRSGPEDYSGEAP